MHWVWGEAGGGRSRSGVGGAAFAAALLQPEAVAVHLQDVDVVGEPIEQGSCEAFGSEDFGPLLEGQVRGDQSGAAFIALAEHLEEQLGSGLGQRHEAQLIDDQQFIAGDLLLEAEQLLVVASFDQLADQGGGGASVP